MTTIEFGDVTALERELQERAVSLQAFCRAAEIAPSTLTRWKNGDTMPNARTWRHCLEVLDRLAACPDADGSRIEEREAWSDVAAEAAVVIIRAQELLGPLSKVTVRFTTDDQGRVTIAGFDTDREEVRT